MPATAAKSRTLIAESPAAAEKPKHKLAELTTYELRDYRRELEKAIAFFDQQNPVPPARAGLQVRLDAVGASTGERRGCAPAVVTRLRYPGHATARPLYPAMP